MADNRKEAAELAASNGHKTVNVTVALLLTTEFLSDILVIAFDGAYGGCWYWARPAADKPHEKVFTIEGDTWWAVRITEKDPEGKRRTWNVDHARLVKGISKLFEPKVLPKRGDIRSAIIQIDAGQIDAEGADIIVQLAVFGELVYG